ncbi:MAG: hypothetical protein M1835_007931 [Candelina submexicana]|nr:MAG: hypothetical protein M1835_007931 [Candelina submexicana]
MDQTKTVISNSHHGVKRKAQDHLENERRLSKRLSLLNINSNGNLYLPVQIPPPGVEVPSGSRSEDIMHLDDTRYKTYIRDLDAELEDLDERNPENVVFLPDIEKKLTRIPASVLMDQPNPSGSNEMVLYSVPTSLSVPQEQDNVRKAIIETRARVREQQIRDAQGTGTSHGDSTTSIRSTATRMESTQDYSNASGPNEEDVDAMEIE